MLRVCVTAELQLFLRRQLQYILQVLANLHQDLLRFALPTLALSDRSRPETDPVKALAHVDHHAHDLVVAVVFERLADCGELSVQPELVDVHERLVAPAVGPFAAVLVLRVFPFGADALLEEMVVGLLGEVGAGGDVVLESVSGVDELARILCGLRRCPRTPQRCRT